MNTIPPDFFKYLSPETIDAIRSDLVISQAILINCDKFTSKIDKDNVAIREALTKINSYLAQVTP